MQNTKPPWRNEENKPFNKNLKGGDKLIDSTNEFDHIEPIQAQPLEIVVYGNFDKAMRMFRSLIQKERILSLYKEKQSYEKASDKKRRKKNEMKRKLLNLDLQDPSFKKKNKRDREEE